MPVSDRMNRNPNCVGIVIDRQKVGFKGKVYNCFSLDPQDFYDVTDLFTIVNGVLDALNFPAIKTRVRHFKKTKSAFVPSEIDVENKLRDAKDLLSAEDKDGFVIMIIGRDNATWQGVLYDKKKDVEFNFNSEVELIKLLK